MCGHRQRGGSRYVRGGVKSEIIKSLFFNHQVNNALWLDRGMAFFSLGVCVCMHDVGDLGDIKKANDN